MAGIAIGELARLRGVLPLFRKRLERGRIVGVGHFRCDAQTRAEAHQAPHDEKLLELGRQEQHRFSCKERLCGHLVDRKSTRLNSSHTVISYAVFCLKKKKLRQTQLSPRPMPSTSSRYPQKSKVTQQDVQLCTANPKRQRAADHHAIHETDAALLSG